MQRRRMEDACLSERDEVKELGYSFEADRYRAADTTTLPSMQANRRFVELAVQRMARSEWLEVS